MTREMDHNLPQQEPAKPAYLADSGHLMPALLIIIWMVGLAQGLHVVLEVFTDPYLTDHKANPVGFLGLCSLIYSMSFLRTEVKPPLRLSHPV